MRYSFGFKSPRTFTREDIVEINCHGGMFVTNKILELILLKGARMAEAGGSLLKEPF